MEPGHVVLILMGVGFVSFGVIQFVRGKGITESCEDPFGTRSKSEETDERRLI